MPDETQEIEPALTVEEWKMRRKFRPRNVKPPHDDDHWGLDVEAHPITGFTVGDDTNESSSSHRDPDDIFAIMALANAALPDDDPRKITRKDMRLLATLMRFNVGGQNYDFQPTIEVLRAKLEALLPPE